MDYKSKNILIAVKSIFLPQYSNLDNSEYVFGYYITISNNENDPVQIIKRHWEIIDANGNTKIVDGIGVVGEQPIINPGEKYNYNSFCPLETEFGKMSGHYKMKDYKGTLFNIPIPEFSLISPSHLN